MSRLSVSAYVEFHQHTNRTFDPYMPIVIIGALVGGAALAVMYGVHSIPGQLAAEGAVCYALVIIIGVPTCVLMNHQIASWSIQNPPREWAQMRARWSVSRHSNVILRSRAHDLSSCRDVKYRPSSVVFRFWGSIKPGATRTNRVAVSISDTWKQTGSNPPTESFGLVPSSDRFGGNSRRIGVRRRRPGRAGSRRSTAGKISASNSLTT
jgi:hypothetical protein